MILTRKQEEGLKIAVQRHRANEKYTIISGYAGSGKSTLVRFIIDALDVEEDKVCYCAFTGKAAEILRKKGNKNVCTLHKLLYEHFPRPAGGFFRKPKSALGYDIIVVDEVSMAPKTLMDLLFTHQVYVICLGDPFQLPPIDKEEDNHLLDKPHIFLDEIMRQAQESEIIRLTMKIRNQESIEKDFGSKEVKILNKQELNTGVLQWGDQILTATNAKKQMINTQMRALAGHEGPPVDGDKVICLRNYWDDISNINGDSLINGTIGYLNNSFKTFVNIPHFVQSPVSSFDVLSANIFIPDSLDYYEDVAIDYKMLTTGEKCCDWRLSYQLGRLRPKYGEIVPKEFAYAYAITIWKAQGSEWNNVVVLEESFPFDKETHARAMYTAATRASKKLVWVRQ
jgi:exodeoxyribonuclease-5